MKTPAFPAGIAGSILLAGIPLRGIFFSYRSEGAGQGLPFKNMNLQQPKHCHRCMNGTRSFLIIRSSDDLMR
jgi:hypothetical protein